MFKIERTNKSEKNYYIYILFIFMFLTGLLNSEDFFKFSGVTSLATIGKLSLYFLLATMIFFLAINTLFKGFSFQGVIRYWIVLLFAVLMKFFILFVQDPSWLYPRGRYFFDFFDFIILLSVMIMLSGVIGNFQGIKVAIWGLGLGASFSALIPMLFFPEMIGSREVEVQGYYFSGGFWNSAVISYISVGWLMVALSPLENSKIKRFLLISIFLILVFGGIAGLSRATLLSVFVSVFVYLIFAKKFKKYIKVILTGLVILLLIVNLFPELFSNFSERLDGGINIEEEARTRIWFDYLEDLPNYFLFGAIDGDFKKYSTYDMGPHSVVLNWLVQFGILGLLGFLILIIGLIGSIKKIKEQFSTETSSALYAWLAAYLSVALVNETGFDEITIFAAFGIILAWRRVSIKISS